MDSNYIELIGGPYDGLKIVVPKNLHEIRFYIEPQIEVYKSYKSEEEIIIPKIAVYKNTGFFKGIE